MRTLKDLTIVMLCVGVLAPITSCSTLSNMNDTTKSTLIGTGAGGAVGAGVGALIGGGKGTWIGALVGSAIGAGASAIISNRMEKQKAELEQELAQVRQLAGQKDTTIIIQTIKDSNHLDAIKVVLGDAILFKTGSAALSAEADAALSRIAYNLNQNPKTYATIVGYTDNTGTVQVNNALSLQRAQSVMDYLISQGVASSRLSAQGDGSNNPVASNDTAAGRAQNRRVEIYITANEQMINEANM